MTTATIGQLKGLNQDTELSTEYLSSCKNIFCLAGGGFSTLKGRAQYLDASLGAGTYLYEAVWPDGHKSIIIRAGRDIYAVEAGVAIKLNNPFDDSETRDTALSHPGINEGITHWPSASIWLNFPFADHDHDGVINAIDMTIVNRWYSEGYITKAEQALAEHCSTFTQEYYSRTKIKDFIKAWLPPELTVSQLCYWFEGQTGYIDQCKVENYFECGLITREEYNRLKRDVGSVGSIEDYLTNIAVTQNQYDQWFSADNQNPTHITSFNRGRYIVGADYKRDKAFYWDGRIDHSIGEISTSGYTYQVIEEFAGRLFGIGNKEFPLTLFHGDAEELNILPGNFITLRDNPRASRLVGMRTFSNNAAYIWGDYGIWALEYTGEYPLFAVPVVVDNMPDCVSNNSIVKIPGVGFAWMGKEYPWLLSNDRAERIDLDKTGARRIKDLLNKRSLLDLHRISGFYDEVRKVVVWSFPSEACSKGHPWRDPISITWDWALDAFTELDQGYEGSCEIDYLGHRHRLVTDQDGFVWLYDYEGNRDKAGDAVEWNMFTCWLGTGAKKTKWKSMTLNRPAKGTDKVYVSVFDEGQAGAVSTGQTYFSMKDSFDQPSASSDTTIDHPSFNPGGPDDLGLPPIPTIDMSAPILIVSRYIKVQLFNNDTAGPDIPMRKLEIEYNDLR